MVRLLAIAIFVAASLTPATAQETARAIFAGGCFWCVEADFDKVEGVLSTTSGYIGGENASPTYQNHPGHREAVEIVFNPGTVSYEELLYSFFRSVDPTDGGGQFCDRGHSYSTAVYAVGEDQLQAAREAKKAASEALGGTELATEIVPAPQFWPAEDYHQDYYTRNPLRYRFYRSSCGRDARIEEVWGGEAMAGIK